MAHGRGLIPNGPTSLPDTAGVSGLWGLQDRAIGTNEGQREKGVPQHNNAHAQPIKHPEQ